MADLNQMKWAVSHDPCRMGDRTPSGAVPAGTIVHLALRVEEQSRSQVVSAAVLVGERSEGYSGLIWSESALAASGEGFAGFLTLDAAPHVVFYAFVLRCDDGVVAYYVPRADGRATAGELVIPGVDGEWTPQGWRFASHRLAERPSGGFGLAEEAPGFQVTVFEPSFATPSWMAGAILYQIFPDRFARGTQGVRTKGVAYHEQMRRPMHLRGGWDEPVGWLGANADNPSAAGEAFAESDPDLRAGEVGALAVAYDPIDFYGGTLEGIRQKLPYIASLGVEALYLNPIFEARSNHRYDTADYEHVDALLGSDGDFERLARDAQEQGIALVLDAVLSHTGDDSRYFNARGTYEDPGAAQGGQSPYFKWYDFECLSGRVPYRCWWGDPTLPEVDERDPSWQDYILGPGGVLERWLAAGARGYRLDVADELPDDVLEKVRSCVKRVDSDAALIGEVWEDATTKESYGVPRTYALGSALDSVMNYPLRSVLLGFALGVVDALQLATFLRLQQSNYPPQLHACLMNLLSSHDVERVRTALALGEPVKHLTRLEQYDLVCGITEEQDARAAALQRMIVALLYALPGMPSIYYGDERGLQGGGDPFCRATFPQSDEEAQRRADCGVDLTDFYREVGMLHKGAPALRTGDFACAAPHDDVLCVIRVSEKSGSAAIVASNRSDREHTVAFDASSPELGLPPASRWMARRMGRVTGSAVFGVAATSGETLCCEDGVVRVCVGPCSTAYWLVDAIE